MKARTILIALLFAAPLAAALLPSAAGAGSVRLVVLGDTDTTTAAQKNVDGALADGAQGMVGTGDYYYYSSATAWKEMFAPLTSKGAHLSIGNHDERTKLAELFPEGTQWTREINGVRFVALNSMRDFSAGSPDHTLIRGWLCGATEDVKVLVMHHNWWLTDAAHHPGSEFRSSPATMDKLLTDCGVDMVLAGHEHNYQRMVRNGIQYVIQGAGGRSLYPVEGTPTGTVATHGGYGRLMIDVSADGISAQFKALDGSVKDSFQVGAGAGTPTTSTPDPAPSGDVTFAPGGGNEWWIEVDVDGDGVARVDARDTGDAWVALAKKSWGDWAASFRVESGHDVQYRAVLTDGRVVESCWYDHPAGGCVEAATTPTPTPTTPTEPAGTATFTAKGGNGWWVQVDVTGSPTAVAARDTGGAWVSLSKKSWGDWAGSFRVESGHDVQYRASFADGSVAESCWYDHPATTCVEGTAPTATEPTPEPTSSFTASFRNVRGNEWWVETDVDAQGATLKSVEARVDGGAWNALTLKSWGSWAKSLRAPDGSTVELRAIATDGATTAPARYAWPPA